MNLITQQLADLSQFEVDEDDLGRTLDILAATYVDFKPTNSKRAVSYPFILVGREYGKVPGVKDSISVTYVTTLFDIVQSYKNGQPSVYDLGYEDGKFVDEYEREELITLDIAELSGDDKKFKIKISEELTDYGIDNNVNMMQGTSFALLRQEDFEEFLSTEPLLERLAETPKSFRTNVVQGGLLAVFQEGAQDYDSLSLVELLNWYQENIYDLHLEGYNKLFNFSSNRSDSFTVNAKNVQAVHLFTEPKEEAVEENKEELLEFMYPIYEGPELSFHKITKKKGDDTVIGGYAVTADGTRVFASADEVTSFAVDSNTVHTGQVLVNLFEIVLGADTSNALTTKNKVISSESIFKIYRGLASK